MHTKPNEVMRKAIAEARRRQEKKNATAAHYGVKPKRVFVCLTIEDAERILDNAERPT